ncbi:MAG: hypothetical protein WCO56_06535 [Verrucomicrobiota bacterium]
MKKESIANNNTIFQQEEKSIQQARETLADGEFRKTPWAKPFATLLASYEKLWAHTCRVMRISDRFQEQLQAAKAECQCAEAALRVKNAELEAALAKVKSLSGLLPICSGCKKIRDDLGYWNQVESYIQKHSEATFTHGLCPECIKRYFPGLEEPPK